MASASAPVDELGTIFIEPKAYADPESWHAAAARLRAEAPILRVAYPAYPTFWAITKHADVMEIERNPEIFTNEPVPVLGPSASLEAAGDLPVKTLIQMDGDQHKAHRNIVNDWFLPGNVRRLQARVDELAVQTVDRMAARGGECDFVRDVALEFPLQVILSILGLPTDDYTRMLQLTQELFGAEDPDIGRMGDDQSVMDVILDFVTYFTALAGDRRTTPTDDLASVIANARLGGELLPDLDMLGHFLIITTAGHDTTSNAIGGGMLALIERPDQLELLQKDPELVANAADELIRWVSPVKHFMRTCQQPFELRGVAFQPGEHLLLSYASANRDDEVFPEPSALDVRRENASSQLAFGFGRHFCLGAHLARMEVRSLFRELLGRIDHVELAGEATWIRANFVQGPKSIPIRYTFR